MEDEVDFWSGLEFAPSKCECECRRADLSFRTWNCSLRGVGCLDPGWVLGLKAAMLLAAAVLSCCVVGLETIDTHGSGYGAPTPVLTEFMTLIQAKL